MKEQGCVWAFDLGKGSIGEGVRTRNEFLHRTLLSSPVAFGEAKSTASDEGDIGRGHMQRIQDVETRTPVILTTSQLLTTGLDAPACRNVVVVRLVNSMVEFKQIIGRGTRVRDDHGKLWFNRGHYTAEKVRTLCASPDELRARWTDADQRADIIQQLASRRGIAQPARRCRRAVRLIPRGERGLDFATVAAQAGQPDAAPFDLLCYLAFPPAGLAEASARRQVLTRRQRADRLKGQELVFFNYFKPEAREILNDLLEKYAGDGELQLVAVRKHLPNMLKVPPIFQPGIVDEDYFDTSLVLAKN